MRLGVVWVPCNNAYYRAVEPLREMVRRGHDVVWPPDGDGAMDLERLADCQVVHVYRRSEEATRRILPKLVRRGVAITYDNDDDFTACPEESPNYGSMGGVEGKQIFGAMLGVARMARCFTTTSEALADKYRQAGVERIEVIDNCLAPDTARPRIPHEGLVIGWVAGGEHYAEVARIPIADALRRVVEKHDHVRVECIGVDLGLPQRYRHDPHVDFAELPRRLGGFDIGIAPLADIPYNRARSDVKLKEYAASGAAWLASPVGPYHDRGEREGGRLVSDDGWFEALDRLVSQPEELTLLAERARAWGERQMIGTAGARWERVFAEAAGVDLDRPAPAFVLGSGGAVRLRPRPRASRGRNR